MKTFKEYITENMEDEFKLKERTQNRLVIKPIRGFVVGAKFEDNMGRLYPTPLLKIRDDKGNEVWELESEVVFEDEDV
jgi:hypothetical protein